MAYSDRFGRSRLHDGEPARAKRLHGVTGSDLADIVRLIERKLAWYGFTSVKVGPFIRLQGHKAFIDLLEQGEVLCRLEVRPGATPADGHGLATLMSSLRVEPRRKMREINPAA